MAIVLALILGPIAAFAFVASTTAGYALMGLTYMVCGVTAILEQRAARAVRPRTE